MKSRHAPRLHLRSGGGTFHRFSRLAVRESALDISQSLYPILAGVLLVLAAAAWMFVRRNGGGASRIEPIMDTAATERRLAIVEQGSASVDAALPAIPDGVAEPKVEAPAPSITATSDRAIEQGYRGFRIRLREKQPGLWVALIADGAPRARKKGADDRKILATSEFYQFPAALAEAKTMIDRRLAARH